jgi:hypothetical protein
MHRADRDYLDLLHLEARTLTSTFGAPSCRIDGRLLRLALDRAVTRLIRRIATLPDAPDLSGLEHQVVAEQRDPVDADMIGRRITTIAQLRDLLDRLAPGPQAPELFTKERVPALL